MRNTIPAIFDTGVFRPLEPVDLAEGTHVEVQVLRPTKSVAGEPSPEEPARQAIDMDWPDFVARTYGSCAGLGLERQAQGDFDPREPIA